MRGSRNFRQGGGGVQSDKKSSDKVFFFFFFFFFFLAPKLILQKSNGQYFKEIYHFFKVPKGVQHSPGGGGGPTFSRGSNCLFPIETHIRVRTPCPLSGSALVKNHLPYHQNLELEMPL